MIESDVHKVAPLRDKLHFWFNNSVGHFAAGTVVCDAIREATKAETVEWLAEIARRYGFEPPP